MRPLGGTFIPVLPHLALSVSEHTFLIGLSLNPSWSLRNSGYQPTSVLTVNNDSLEL